MKSYRNKLINNAAVAAVLALGILGVTAPALAAENTTEAEKAAVEKYERDALTFEANADLHARMAEHYRAPSNDGSKQRMTLWSLANHYDWLAKIEAQAAQRARNIGAMHRKLLTAA